MVRSKIATVFASIAAVIGLSLPLVTQAETPALGWTAVRLDASETNIRTDGTFKYAYTASTTELTANGVTFSPWVSAGWDAYTPLRNDDVLINKGFGRNTNAGSGSATGGYATLLGNSFTNNELGDYDIVLSGLESGKRYLAQVIVRNNNDHPRLSVRGNSEVWVQPNGYDGAQSWDYGGSLVCVFEATGSTFTLELNYSVATPIAFNAIQVRDLSGGDDPDPTVVDPEIGLITATANGMAVRIDLADIELGTDAQGASATSYKVDYVVCNSGGTTIKSGTVLSGQTAETASFNITDFTDPGTYTCVVKITTDKETTASKSVQFTLTGEDPPTPGPTEGWTAVKMTTDSSSIRKDGVLVYAYAYGDYTANGVEFKEAVATDATAKTITNDDLTWVLTDGLLFQKHNGFAGVEDTGYKNLMGNCWGCQNTDPHTIELKGLTSGSTYLVQIIGCNYTQDNDGKIWVQETAGQTFGDDTPYMYTGGTHDGDDWTCGGSLIGVFTAESSTKSITLKYKTGSWAGFNAIQVRDISSVGPTPATYAVSWTGGENADVDVKANGSAIDSGALVGDGTNVVFTVTPNTDYEFAETSYPDWTKSGDNLTRTVTVNGAALSVTVPNATKKPDPPAPTAVWTAAPMSESGDTIRTDGELVYALAGGQSSGSSLGEITVNGVPFTTIKSFTDYPTSQYTLPFTVSPNVSYDASGLNDQGVSGDYAQMLDKGFWNDKIGEYAVTLNGLEAGNRYLVQIVCHRDTTGYTVVAPDGVATIGTGKTGWTYGGSLVGVFTATGPSYTFTINYVSSGDGTKAHFNAFQVRKLPDEPDPEHELGWTAAPMTADPTVSIRKDGVFCYAYACGGNRTVNGVEFLKLDPTDNENLSWNLGITSSTGNIDGFSGDYNDLLKYQWWSGGDTLTLRNLIPGHDYLVQVIGCRYDHGDTKQTKVTVVEAGDDSIYMKAAGDDEWIYGGTLVGVFNASDTTQTFHFKKISGSWSAFNAIQVRDLSLTDDDAVAIIERGATTNYFFAISDAYIGAAENETIKLVKDADFPMNYPVFSKSVDLDLNGHSITRSNVNRVKEITSETVISNGTLAFATEAYSADLATPFFVDGAALTLDALKVGDSAGNEPICLMTLTNSASVVLSGDGVYHAGSLFKSYDDGDTMTITGGRYILRGWTFPGDETGDFADYDKGTLTISGGAFSIAPDKDWVASGYVILHDVTDRETPYHVVPAAEAPCTESDWTYCYKDAAAAESAYVAKRETADGVKYYTSVQDAVEAANGSGTVTLVADVPTIDREVVLTGTVTLDGNGHSISVAHPYVDESGYVSKNYSFNVLHVVSVPKGSDAVLRNVSITGGGTVNGEKTFHTLAEKGLSAVANEGTLLMENVTVTRSNGAIVNLNGGKLFMDNCRIVRNCRFCAGGLFNMHGGFAVMNRTSLSENRSLGAGGGGGAAENGGTLFVNNCVVVNNSSTEVGGAINNYGSDRDAKLYLMNTTIAGNFSSISGTANQYDGMMGGGLGLQHGDRGGEVIAVNSIITCNYQTRTDSSQGWNIKESDILSLEGDMGIGLYYTVFTAMDVNPAGSVEATTNNVRQLDVDNENVFNAYYASERIYQNANPTAMAINSAQLIAKDDGSLDASLARYAPILRKLNDEKTAYVYGDAVYGTAGVYTYFDASNWKNSEVKMAYATVNGTPDFFDYDSAGDLQQIGNIPLATAADMVTNYYESASGRSFGVAGASGWLMDEKIHYTVKLAGEPENGTVSGVTLFGETYEAGTKITLTATPGYARDFLGWYEVIDSGATTNFLTGSANTVWELTVNQNYELLAKFSDLQEVLTPDPYVHVKMADDTEGPLLYPITVMTKWMRDHYDDFEETLAGKRKEEAEAWLTQILEQTSPGTGRKMWQDYLLGVDPNDVNAKIWINSPQYMSTSKDLIRMEMNRLSPVSGTKFTINYRLDKMLGSSTTFARTDVNATGSYDVKVENDPTGLYIIDLLFIPEGKSTSEEYVTTVNTAGVLRVENHSTRAAVAVPWTKLQSSGSSAVSALDLVKTTNLTAGDRLYVYDGSGKDYLAWEMLENGNWSPLNVFKIDEYGFVNTTGIDGEPEGSAVARGLGLWLERANTNDYIYLCGQYEAAPVAETALSTGWNLVGNPATEPFDIKTVTPSDGDQIIVPTAAEPKNYTYENKAWGYWKKEIVERGGRKSVQTVRETGDTTVPAGCGFWYISDGGGTLDWTGATEEE